MSKRIPLCLKKAQLRSLTNPNQSASGRGARSTQHVCLSDRYTHYLCQFSLLFVITKSLSFPDGCCKENVGNWSHMILPSLENTVFVRLLFSCLSNLAFFGLLFFFVWLISNNVCNLKTQASPDVSCPLINKFTNLPPFVSSPLQPPSHITPVYSRQKS